MKNLLILLLTLAGFSNHALSQNPEKRYRTEDGVVYNWQQIDSIARLQKPVSMVKDTVIEGKAFTMIRISESVAAFREFTGRYKGQPLPELKLTLMDGKVVNTGDLKGKVVMINFWSTTCQPCIAEMPQLNQLHADYKDKVVFLAPLPENQAAAERLLARHSFTFAIAPDAQATFDQLGIEGYPKNFFVDRDGIIREVVEGTPIKKDPEGKMQVVVYESYAGILDELIGGQ